jgi:hypothetical protein
VTRVGGPEFGVERRGLQPGSLGGNTEGGVERSGNVERYVHRATSGLGPSRGQAQILDWASFGAD